MDLNALLAPPLVLLVLAACVGLAVLVGRSFAETHEESLAWKLAGHGVLGFFLFTFNGFPLPLGYVIALILAGRATINQKARRAASTTTFLLWLIGLLIGPMVG